MSDTFHAMKYRFAVKLRYCFINCLNIGIKKTFTSGADMQQRISAVGVSAPTSVYRTIKDIFSYRLLRTATRSFYNLTRQKSLQLK